MKVVKEEEAFLPKDSTMCKAIDPWAGKPSLVRMCNVADMMMIEGQDRKSQSPSDITKAQNQPWAHPVVITWVSLDFSVACNQPNPKWYSDD